MSKNKILISLLVCVLAFGFFASAGFAFSWSKFNEAVNNFLMENSIESITGSAVTGFAIEPGYAYSDKCGNNIGWSEIFSEKRQTDNCCCYITSHILDFGKVIPAADSVLLNYTLYPLDLKVGGDCVDNPKFYVSSDGKKWTAKGSGVYAFPGNNIKVITNVKNFRYVKISSPKCAVVFPAAYVYVNKKPARFEIEVLKNGEVINGIINFYPNDKLQWRYKLLNGDKNVGCEKSIEYYSNTSWKNFYPKNNLWNGVSCDKNNWSPTFGEDLNAFPEGWVRISMKHKDAIDSFVFIVKKCQEGYALSSRNICVQAGCKDEDSGQDPFKKGTCKVTDKNGNVLQSRSDFCHCGQGTEYCTLGQIYCKEDACVYDYTVLYLDNKYKDYTCGDGVIIKKEATKKAEEEASKKSCKETDNGKDYIAAGKTTDNAGYQNDACTGKTTLREYYCNIGAGVKESVEYDCAKENKECLDGRCIEGCKDSDGEDYYTKGFVTNPAEFEKGVVANPLTNLFYKTYDKAYDYCIGNVREFSCKDGKLWQEAYLCPDGCKDGACIKCPEGYKADSDLICRKDGKTCTDSDSGEDFYTKGTVIDTETSWQGNTWTDSCTGDYVQEFSCYEDDVTGYRAQFENSGFKCPNGCKDGACIQDSTTRKETAATCTDSDGGLTYETKGNVTDSKQTSYDHCKDGKKLYEYFCNEGIRSVVIYACPNGCKDGACAKSVTTANRETKTNTVNCDYGAWDKTKIGQQIKINEKIYQCSSPRYYCKSDTKQCCKWTKSKGHYDCANPPGYTPG